MNFPQLIHVIGPPVHFLSTEPFFFAKVPALDTVHDKLASFMDGVPSLAIVANYSKIKDDLTQQILPWLKQRYVHRSATRFHTPPLRHLPSSHPRTNHRSSHADAARQSAGINQ
jgi:hypothetical protein